MKYLMISELAKAADTTPYTVRNYVQEGLLCRADHTPGGFGLYDQAALERLIFIRAARDAGILIIDIKPLIHALDDNEQAKVEDHAEKLKGKVDQLMKQLMVFNKLLEELS